MIITRHGAGSHYVRPDRVYRTGVLQSMYGYSPQQDVMAVAQAFTTGPYNFMQGGMMPYVSNASPNAQPTPPTSAGVAGPSIHLLGGPPMRRNSGNATPLPDPRGHNCPAGTAWTGVNCAPTAQACGPGGCQVVACGPGGCQVVPVVQAASSSAQPTPMMSQGVAGPSVRLLGAGVGAWWPPATWGWWAKFKLKFGTWCGSKTWCASKFPTTVAAAQAAALPPAPPPTSGISGIGFTPMGTRLWAASQAVPGPGQRVAMLVAMQQKNQPAQIALQNTNALLARWAQPRLPTR